MRLIGWMIIGIPAFQGSQLHTRTLQNNILAKWNGHQHFLDIRIIITKTLKMSSNLNCRPAMESSEPHEVMGIGSTCGRTSDSIGSLLVNLFLKLEGAEGDRGGLSGFQTFGSKKSTFRYSNSMAVAYINQWGEGHRIKKLDVSGRGDSTEQGRICYPLWRFT